jgi:hypothetical protein
MADHDLRRATDAARLFAVPDGDEGSIFASITKPAAS